MKFRWSNKEFLLNRQNTVSADDTLYVHHAGSAGYSADRVVACVLTKDTGSENMAQVKSSRRRRGKRNICGWQPIVPVAGRQRASAAGTTAHKATDFKDMTVPHGMPKP